MSNIAEPDKVALSIVNKATEAMGQTVAQLAEGGEGTTAIAGRVMKAVQKADQLSDEGRTAQMALTGSAPEVKQAVESAVRDAILEQGKSPAGRAGEVVKQLVDAGFARLNRKPDEAITDGITSLEDAAAKVIEEGRRQLTQQEIDQTGALDRSNAAAKAMNIADRLRDGKVTPAAEEATWLVKEKLDAVQERA